jgi:hypothetical protein
MTTSFVILSVRPHGTTRASLYGFSWNLNIFRKSFQPNSCFIKLWQQLRVYNMKTNTHFWAYLAPVLRMRNVSENSCRENQNTHFIFNTFLSWKIPYSRTDLRWHDTCTLHAGYQKQQTYTQIMKYFMFSYCSNGCKKQVSVKLYVNFLSCFFWSQLKFKRADVLQNPPSINISWEYVTRSSICHVPRDTAKLIGAALIPIPCKTAESVGICDRWAAIRIRGMPYAYTGVPTIQPRRSFH